MKKTRSVAAKLADTSVASNRNLMLRVASALVLAPLAIGTAWWGGWPFAVFWTIAAMAVWWEWTRLIKPQATNAVIAAGGFALILMALLVTPGHAGKALAIAGLAMLVIIGMSRKNAAWNAGGFVYASALLLAPIIIRTDAQYGFVAILFLFAIVWSSDIGGYFGGRLIGGAKLAPSISPKKTRSGAIVGTLTAMVAALLIAYQLQAEWQIYWFAMTAFAAIFLSVVSQAGDLFESAVKRHFNVKDASNLIPGHGGVMDRLDGFIFAAFAAACLGVLRTGFEAAGRGVLLW